MACRASVSFAEALPSQVIPAVAHCVSWIALTSRFRSGVVMNLS
jgi:hypothetical protein